MADIIVEQLGKVRRLTLNRPEKLNAISQNLVDELLAAIDEAEQSAETHVIILRGAGRSFCAGYDMSVPYGAASPTSGAGTTKWLVPDQVRMLGRQRRYLDRIWHCQIPIVAQIHGHCLAGGTDLVLNCDFIVASEDAKIGYPPLRYFGVPPSQMWLYHVGPQWTKRLMLTGDTVSGQRAAQIGLVQEAVPADELDDHVLTLATRMSQIDRELLFSSKHVINQGVELQGRSVLQTISVTQDAIGHAGESADEFRADVGSKGFARAIADRNALFGKSHIE